MIASNSINLTKNKEARYLGLKSYQDVSDLQDTLVEAVRGTKAVILLGMEFHPVITLGVRGKPQTDLVHSTETVIWPVVTTDRGGQATLHTPGQLVIYPIMDLKEYKLGVREFVCLTMKATSSVLKNYGIESKSGPAPGLYTHQGKIAFLGIRVDRGVVKHGLAINVNNDLLAFGFIKSCGVSAAQVDKIQNHKRSGSLDLEAIFQSWAQAFDNELALVLDKGHNLNSSCFKSFTSQQSDIID